MKTPKTLKASAAYVVLSNPSDHPFSYAEIPRTLASYLLETAILKFDNLSHSEALFKIWLLLVTPGSSWKNLTTPKFVATSPEARIWILKVLLELKSISGYLKLNMYTFTIYKRINEEDCALTPPESVLIESLFSKEYLILNVTSLSLPTITNEKILKLILTYCRKLTSLDIKFSSFIDDLAIFNAFETPGNHRGLITLCMLGTSVSSDCLTSIFESQPFIEKLDIESDIFEDYILNGPPDKTLPLKRVQVSIRKNYQIFYLPKLIECCPMIEEFNIEYLHQALVRSVGVIGSLERLKRLTIGHIDFADLVPLLKLVGHRLETYSYHYYGREALPIGVLLKFLHNVESVTVGAQSLTKNPEFGFINDFQRLKTICLNIHAQISIKVWTGLMTKCLALEIIDITSCENMDDESFDNMVLTAEPKALQNLINFTIRGEHCGNVKLTEISIKRIKNRSPLLRILGDTSTWSLSPCICTKNLPKISNRNLI